MSIEDFEEKKKTTINQCRVDHKRNFVIQNSQKLRMFWKSVRIRTVMDPTYSPWMDAILMISIDKTKLFRKCRLILSFHLNAVLPHFKEILSYKWCYILLLCLVLSETRSMKLRMISDLPCSQE